MSCLFCRIGSGEIPATKMHDDAELFAIRDLNPMAPTHVLIIPHKHVQTILDFSAADHVLVGRVYALAAKFARLGWTRPGTNDATAGLLAGGYSRRGPVADHAGGACALPSRFPSGWIRWALATHIQLRGQPGLCRQMPAYPVPFCFPEGNRR